MAVEINKKKKSAAELSMLSNIVLTLLKIIAGIISGSLSIMSEAFHSLSDFLASILTFFSVLKSSEPADKDHPYGHGKYEDLAGLIEGFLIILAAVFIIYKSFKKIILGTPYASENNLGIIVMLIAVILNSYVSSLLLRTAKQSNSISLYADGQHIRADVYSSLGVLLGLIIIKYTGLTILDPIIAILIALIILRTGYKIYKQSVNHLLDYSLPDSDIEKIKEIVQTTCSSIMLSNDSIRARQVGPSMDIDIVIKFPETTSICECHKVCDEIEKKIQAVYIDSSISIHPEPMCYSKNCRESCEKCF